MAVMCAVHCEVIPDHPSVDVASWAFPSNSYSSQPSIMTGRCGDRSCITTLEEKQGLTRMESEASLQTCRIMS